MTKGDVRRESSRLTIRLLLGSCVRAKRSRSVRTGVPASMRRCARCFDRHLMFLSFMEEWVGGTPQSALSPSLLIKNKSTLTNRVHFRIQPGLNQTRPITFQTNRNSPDHFPDKSVPSGAFGRVPNCVAGCRLVSLSRYFSTDPSTN